MQVSIHTIFIELDINNSSNRRRRNSRKETLGAANIALTPVAYKDSVSVIDPLPQSDPLYSEITESTIIKAVGMPHISYCTLQSQ